MSNRFQLSLVIIIFLLTLTILLFGWVYLDNINSKYTSLLFKPEDKKITALEKEIKKLQEKITTLEAQLTYNQEQAKLLTTTSSTFTLRQPLQENVIENYPETFEIFLDSKCFADPTDLNQCLILNKTSLDKNVNLLVKPASQITTDKANEIKFEFYNNQKLFTELTISNNDALNTQEPIATIIYLSPNNITLKTKHGPENSEAIFTYDGLDWIDYSKYTFE